MSVALVKTLSGVNLEHYSLPPANVVCEGYVFTPVCDSVQGGRTWPGVCVWPGGDMRGKGGACVVKGGMCGKGGAGVVKGACMTKGGLWQRGVHGKGGACMAKGVGVRGMHTPLYEIWPVNARAVRILLECILVYSCFI